MNRIQRIKPLVRNSMRMFSSSFDFTKPVTFVPQLPMESPSTSEPFGIKISDEAVKVSISQTNLT